MKKMHLLEAYAPSKLVKPDLEHQRDEKKLSHLTG